MKINLSQPRSKSGFAESTEDAERLTFILGTFLALFLPEICTSRMYVRLRLGTSFFRSIAESRRGYISKLPRSGPMTQLLFPFGPEFPMARFGLLRGSSMEKLTLIGSGNDGARLQKSSGRWPAQFLNSSCLHDDLCPIQTRSLRLRVRPRAQPRPLIAKIAINGAQLLTTASRISALFDRATCPRAGLGALSNRAPAPSPPERSHPERTGPRTLFSSGVVSEGPAVAVRQAGGQTQWRHADQSIPL